MPEKYDPKEREPYWQKYWEENSIYSFDPESNNAIFSIDTPPPTVSGKMHMGHASMYSQMDFIARYKRMRGFNLFYPFGTDDNGLATDRLIEKLNNVRSRDMEREDYIKLCLDTLNKIRPGFVNDWKQLAISCDYNIFYSTIDDHSRKISQWSFIELHKNNRIERKFGPVMVCPKCATAIAQVELEDLERDAKLNYIKAEVDNESITFATTRPELMMACIAITVHPDDERYKHLIGKHATIPVSQVKVPILADDMTKMEFGTGAVYWCPYGDINDIEFVAKHPELEVKHIMNKYGKLNEYSGKYKGLNSEKARQAVLKDWEDAGALVKQETIKQVVNTHERCNSVIEFVALSQWYIKVLDMKEDLVRYGKQMTWHPKFMVTRYDNWAKGLKWDWCISRQRYFGIPIPVWYCKKCGEAKIAEESQLPVDPLSDKPIGLCTCGGSAFEPEKDTFDTWATSSLTPKLAIDLFKDRPIHEKLFPMNLRPQAHDIITFWLFNTVIKSQLHTNKNPWHEIMVSGFVLDPHGRKMSKSKGNTVEPQTMMDKYSADALRFWSASTSLGEDIPFQEKELVAGKKFTNKLWNASKFCFLHLADYKNETPKQLEAFDCWLLNKLNKIIQIATDNFDKYEYSKTKLEVDKFFWHVFCDYYLEIIKDRLYNPDRAEAKISAQYTLHHSLLAILKLMAPITPHITDEVYHQYYAEKDNQKSVHITSWPEPHQELIDPDTERIGDIGIEIITVIRKYKSTNNLSLKEDINELILASDMKNFEQTIRRIEADLMAVTRAKKVIFNGETTLKCESFPIQIGIK
jgi:valyl-tRNA synthetase